MQTNICISYTLKFNRKIYEYHQMVGIDGRCYLLLWPLSRLPICKQIIELKPIYRTESHLNKCGRLFFIFILFRSVPLLPIWISTFLDGSWFCGWNYWWFSHIYIVNAVFLKVSHSFCLPCVTNPPQCYSGGLIIV